MRVLTPLLVLLPAILRVAAYYQDELHERDLLDDDQIFLRGLEDETSTPVTTLHRRSVAKHNALLAARDILDALLEARSALHLEYDELSARAAPNAAYWRTRAKAERSKPVVEYTATNPDSKWFKWGIELMDKRLKEGHSETLNAQFRQCKKHNEAGLKAATTGGTKPAPYVMCDWNPYSKEWIYGWTPK